MSQTTKPGKAKARLLLDLSADHPACFDWTNPRPLKLRINQDLITHVLLATPLPEGTSNKQRAAIRRRIWPTVVNALADYCTRPAYLATLVPGAVRVDLDGQPTGVVTERDAVYAAALLRGETPPPRPPREHTAPPELPTDAPLTEDNIVPGRLEITVKFDKLPVPVAVQTGMKIGVRTDNGLVVATLPTKSWKKLAKAATEWSAWGAVLTGRMGAQVPSDAGPVIVMEQPALQVFERKPKPAPVV